MGILRPELVEVFGKNRQIITDSGQLVIASEIEEIARPLLATIYDEIYDVPSDSDVAKKALFDRFSSSIPFQLLEARSRFIDNMTLFEVSINVSRAYDLFALYSKMNLLGLSVKIYGFRGETFLSKGPGENIYSLENLVHPSDLEEIKDDLSKVWEYLDMNVNNGNCHG